MSNPALSASYSADLASADTKPGGEGVARLGRCSDLIDLFRLKLGLSLLLASARSSLIGAVGHVVFLCSEKQVFRIATCAVVAAMQNLQSFRDWPLMQGPRESMRQPSFHIAARTFANYAVSQSAYLGFLPLPATGDVVYFESALKPIDEWKRLSHLLSKFRTGNSSYCTTLGEM